jgi:hypothetical protein
MSKTMTDRARRRMINRARPLLPSGSEIRHAFGAQAAPAWRRVLLWLLGYFAVILPALVVY